MNSGEEVDKKIKNFRDLEIWKKGIEIVKEVYFLIKDFPKNEIYGLKNQMQRASVSIPSNIAEGFNRFHNKEYKQFLYIALGSCAELETQIEISLQLEYIKFKDRDRLIDSIVYESRMIRSLIKKIG